MRFTLQTIGADVPSTVVSLPSRQVPCSTAASETKHKQQERDDDASTEHTPAGANSKARKRLIQAMVDGSVVQLECWNNDVTADGIGEGFV
jgi:hypothetical protein